MVRISSNLVFVRASFRILIFFLPTKRVQRGLDGPDQQALPGVGWNAQSARQLSASLPAALAATASAPSMAAADGETPQDVQRAMKLYRARTAAMASRRKAQSVARALHADAGADAATPAGDGEEQLRI